MRVVSGYCFIPVHVGMDGFQDTELPDASHLMVESPLSAYPSSQENDTTELNV